MQVIDVRLFQTPRWFQYSMAVGTTLIAAFWRARMASVMGDSSPLVAFSFPVAIAAFLGGFGPGLVATALSLTLGVSMFIVPSGKNPMDDLQTAWLVSANATVWLFICMVCDLLRRTAVGLKYTMSERDEHRDRLAAIFDSMDDGFFAVDNDWDFTHSNRAFERYIGKEGQELEGQSFWDVVQGYHRSLEAVLRASKSGQSPTEIDAQVPGTDRWLHFRVFPDQSGMSGYVQEATFRKRIEDHNEQLLADEKTARSDAERASRLKDEFIATLSHELRTPLTSILGWAEVLKNRRGLDAKTREGLEAIERSTRVQTQLVEELLDMSRISVGKVRLEMSYINLVESVNEAVGVFRPSAEAKHIEITVRCEDEDVYVRGDSTRLLQIVSNLVSNAVKFTPEHGKILVELRAEGEEAVFSVKDNGQGIDPYFLPYLFDRFRQANASITRSHGGLGLGLSIARQLVFLHGGTIEAVSEGSGQGSIFKVRLPLVADPKWSMKIDPDLDSTPVKIDGLRILVLDDERETRELLDVMLREAGATVATADSAVAALAAIPTFEPQLILSDIGMPEVDGYEFIRRVRSLAAEDGGGVPAVALTAFARSEDRSKAMAAGFQAHLTKPIEQNVLLKTIRYLAGQASVR